MALKPRQAVVAALALAATWVAFYAVLVAWGAVFLSCPGPPDPAAYVPPLLLIAVGSVVSVLMIRRRSRPMQNAAGWGMLVGWVLVAALMISLQGPPVVCGLHQY